MKNKKFTALLLLTMLLLSCVVTGCGNSITAKECAQIFWDMGVEYDTSNVSKLNRKEEDEKVNIEKVKETEKDTLKNAYTAQGLTVTDEQMAEFYNATLELFKKATVTIEEVSNDGKKAEIKYKTTYVDITKIATKASTEAVESVKTLGLTNQKEIKDKYSELVMKNLVNEVKNATFSEDTKERTYTFTKQDKIWVPDNQETFGKKLGELVSGQAK